MCVCVLSCPFFLSDMKRKSYYYYYDRGDDFHVGEGGENNVPMIANKTDIMRLNRN